MMNADGVAMLLCPTQPVPGRSSTHNGVLYSFMVRVPSLWYPQKHRGNSPLTISLEPWPVRIPHQSGA